jgi:imidazolonepropionase-like amidohydrolase
MQALQTATGWAAECLGIESDIGTIQPGKLADLVVVDGDRCRISPCCRITSALNWS